MDDIADVAWVEQHVSGVWHKRHLVVLPPDDSRAGFEVHLKGVQLSTDTAVGAKLAKGALNMVARTKGTVSRQVKMVEQGIGLSKRQVGSRADNQVHWCHIVEAETTTKQFFPLAEVQTVGIATSQVATESCFEIVTMRSQHGTPQRRIFRAVTVDARQLLVERLSDLLLTVQSGLVLVKEVIEDRAALRQRGALRESTSKRLDKQNSMVCNVEGRLKATLERHGRSSTIRLSTV